MTYLYVPKSTLYSVFSSMDIPYPVIRPANFTALMEPGDQPPNTLSEADIAVTCEPKVKLSTRILKNLHPR
jgi:hypothetical protein